MKTHFLIFIPLLLSCSLFDNEQDFEIYPPNIIGEWIRTDFTGITEFINLSQADTSSIELYMKYTFGDNNTCELESSNSNSFYFYGCKWYINKDDEDYYFFLQFDVDWGIWPGPVYWDLYKIRELSDQKMTLILIDSNNDRDE
ncbi:MAG: hypothetical protein JJ895_06045 [Balneolaceae bacterium]|nr:hypothetical protein [Balneolaceae bacterium]